MNALKQTKAWWEIEIAAMCLISSVLQIRAAGHLALSYLALLNWQISFSIVACGWFIFGEYSLNDVH